MPNNLFAFIIKICEANYLLINKFNITKQSRIDDKSNQLKLILIFIFILKIDGLISKNFTSIKNFFLGFFNENSQFERLFFIDSSNNYNENAAKILAKKKRYEKVCNLIN